MCFKRTLALPALFSFLELCNGFLAIKFKCRLGGCLTILCKIESSPTSENDLVEFLQHGTEPRTITICYFKVHRQREAIDCMSEKKFVRTMSFRHTKIGRKSTLLSEGQDLGPGVKRSLFWKEGLILDESTATIGKFPIWNVIEKETIACIRLQKSMSS